MLFSFAFPLLSTLSPSSATTCKDFKSSQVVSKPPFALTPLRHGLRLPSKVSLFVREGDHISRQFKIISGRARLSRLRLPAFHGCLTYEF